MKNISNTITYDIRTRIFAALALAAVLSLCAYVYAVLATVHHTVAKESLVAERESLSMRVSELEYEDIARRKVVDLETALSQGFREVSSPLYVSRTEDSLTLNTLNTQGTKAR